MYELHFPTRDSFSPAPWLHDFIQLGNFSLSNCPLSNLPFIQLRNFSSITSVLSDFITRVVGFCEMLFLHQLGWSCGFFLNSNNILYYFDSYFLLEAFCFIDDPYHLTSSACGQEWARRLGHGLGMAAHSGWARMLSSLGPVTSDPCILPTCLSVWDMLVPHKSVLTGGTLFPVPLLSLLPLILELWSFLVYRTVSLRTWHLSWELNDEKGLSVGSCGKRFPAAATWLRALF